MRRNNEKKKRQPKLNKAIKKRRKNSNSNNNTINNDNDNSNLSFDFYLILFKNNNWGQFCDLAKVATIYRKI
jgi:hypothetical protein